jgi:hypothetical protein
MNDVRPHFVLPTPQQKKLALKNDERQFFLRRTRPALGFGYIRADAAALFPSFCPFT